MRRSSGFRLFVVGILALLMYVPLFLVGTIVDARSSYNRQVIADVGREWGGPQVLVGPILILPVEGPTEREEEREVRDPATGATRVERTRTTVIEAKAPVYLMPETLDVRLNLQTEERRRGIFVAPVYTAALLAGFSFDVPDLRDLLSPGETVLFDRAEIRIGLTSNAALRGTAALDRDGMELALEPRSDGGQGVFAAVGDPRQGGTYGLQLGVNGAQQMLVSPVGRTTQVRMESDWPHPSFTGSFLPDGSDVRPDGFAADWTIPWLARAIPQQSRYDFSSELSALSFGVRLFQPNDFYQKAWRAAN